MAIAPVLSPSPSPSYAAERCNRLRQRLAAPPPAAMTPVVPTDGSSELLGRLGLTLQGIRDLISRYLKPTTEPAKPENKPEAKQPEAKKEEKPATYTVRSGDSLSRIAKQVLGDANRWREIYELNKDQISDPNKIYPGMVLKLSGKAESKPETKPETKPEPKPSATYTVRSGDTLSRIAQQTLGDGNRWREIYELNRDVIGSNPNALKPGQVLRLSGSAPAIPSAPSAPTSKPSSGKLSDPQSFFVSQYKSVSNSQEDTPNNGNCGPTSLTMVAMAFKKLSVSPKSADDAIEGTRRRMGASSSQYDGTSYAELQRGAQSYGLNAKVLYGGLDVIRSQLKEGRLVIAHVRPNYLFPKTTSGHYTVVTKIENGRVYLNDPANPKGPMSISEAQFLEAQKLRGAYGLISIGD